MSIELQNDVKSSVILKLYNKFSKLAKYITTFKWIIGIAFVIGLIDLLVNGKVGTVAMWINILVWIPGFLIAFTGSILHFLTGVKLRNLVKKHGMNQDTIQKLVEEILN